MNGDPLGFLGAESFGRSEVDQAEASRPFLGADQRFIVTRSAVPGFINDFGRL